MPIYEYKAADRVHCKLCGSRFEVRQGMNDEPLETCPLCGARVTRLVSRPFLGRGESPGQEESFDRYSGDEPGGSDSDEDFPDDETWE